ncbi:MAG: hypothetical protein HYT21_00140 [Candidatus Nealsonbacteria bacterium]|nr:hypothetical protein [Candidatus Nealsonbacteria bacterium]
MIKKEIFPIVILILLFLPLITLAQGAIGESAVFNVEPSYDFYKRSEISATLIKMSPTLYIYAESAWWNGLDAQAKQTIEESLDSISEEFEDNIYPSLTNLFGQEWKPGIDKDTRITLLIHQMPEQHGGYTNTADEYPRVQVPKSNEREMIYLNAQYISSAARGKIFLSHELVHLITFNQKERANGVTEDVWLNEARAEYAATILGYDDEYGGSNLADRAKKFINKPADSLTEWQETQYDYGVTNLFVQYLVDHYGRDILVDSLRSKKTGIASINEALLNKGFSEDFSEVFNNWAIAVLVNDCSLSDKYCYFNKNLQDFRITPLMNYLPLNGESTLSVTNSTKDWAGNWHRFVGGGDMLELEFRSLGQANFEVPYVVKSNNGNYSVNRLKIDKNGIGKINLNDFGQKYTWLTILPIAKNKVANFNSLESARFFFWSASTLEEGEEQVDVSLPSIPPLTKPIAQMSRAEIEARISQLLSIVMQLQSILNTLQGGQASCIMIDQELYLGMENNAQVRCLQEFLKGQGTDIYPEGLITGNFYTLTQQAVIRFQQKYAAEILSPLGLTRGTGYVGSSTLAKINELLTR